MILGTGIDIVEIERLKSSIDKYEDNFLAYYLNQTEMAALPKNAQRLSYCAGRWAAKEAVAKALGTGFGRACHWHDITITNDDFGAPECTLSGVAAETARGKGIKVIHISISHEMNYACATAIAEG